MRCSDCRRQINKPALIFKDRAYGPVCARRYLPAATNERLVSAPVRVARVRAVVVPESQLALEFA